MAISLGYAKRYRILWEGLKYNETSTWEGLLKLALTSASFNSKGLTMEYGKTKKDSIINKRHISLQ